MFEAIMTALKVVGVVLGAKTAIEGLKEGNIMKAALGGIGAYMAGSSLATSTAGTQAQMNNIGMEGAAADKMASVTPVTQETLSATELATNAPASIAEPVSVADPTSAASSALKSSASAVQTAAPAATPLNNLPDGMSIGDGMSVGSQYSTPNLNGPYMNTPGPIDLGSETSLMDSLLLQGKEIGNNVNDLFKTNEQSQGGGLMDTLGGAWDKIQENQALLGYLIRDQAGKRNQEFLQDQIDERNAKEEQRLQWAMQVPTYKYNYGV